MAEPVIRIKFELTDEFDNFFSAESKIAVFNSLGYDIPFEIGRQLNTFLRQAGYPRSEYCIFMEDISEEEYDALADFLADYRRKGENNENSD